MNTGPRRRTVLTAGAASALAASAGLLGATPARARFGGPAALPLGFAPNIVFVLTDDGPINSYGLVENAFPVVGQRYRGHWLSYPNASCNDPLCAPGRAATLSGLVSQHHGVIDNQTGVNLNLGATWVEALHRAGYRCGGYGKLINGFGDEGFPGVVPPGFDDFHMLVGNPGYFDYDLNNNGVVRHYGKKDNNLPGTHYLTDVNRYQILKFISETHRANPDQPWAVYWAPNAPHKDGGGNVTGPLPPDRYDETTVTLTDPPNFNAGPQAQMPWLADAQAREPLDVDATHTEHTLAMQALMAVNEGLQAIIDRVDSLGLLDRTVFVVTTDNGHIYGAHGLQDKGTAFEESLNLLLRVRYPGAPDGETRPQAVSNIDIAPFMCELAGATMAGAVDGQSFVATLLDPSAPFREAAPICHAKDGPGTPAFDGLRFPDRKVIKGRKPGHAKGQAWMHNLLTDPYELNALPPSSADLAKLKRMLDGFS